MQRLKYILLCVFLGFLMLGLLAGCGSSVGSASSSRPQPTSTSPPAYDIGAAPTSTANQTAQTEAAPTATAQSTAVAGNPSAKATLQALATAQAGGAEANVTPAPATPAPIERHAELSHPAKLEVNKPTRVKFSLFTPENPPAQDPGAATSQTTVRMPQMPELTPYVSVELDVGGATVSEVTAHESQPLYEMNKWEFDVTASEPQTITIHPLIRVAYKNTDGKEVYHYDATVPGDQVIPKSQVVNNIAAEATGNWFASNLLGVMGVVLGLPGTIISWRGLFGKSGVAKN